MKTNDNKGTVATVPIYQPLVLRPGNMTPFGVNTATYPPLYTMYQGNYDCGYFDVPTSVNGGINYGWQTTFKLPAISDTRPSMQPSIYLAKILFTTSTDRGTADLRITNNLTNVTTTVLSINGFTASSYIMRRMVCGRITNISEGNPDVTYTLTLVVTGTNPAGTGSLCIWNKISILNCHVNTNVL